jgi:hypothetical protein
MNRNLLKEAIADAKAVKETAIANAKVVLEEAFSPKLREMFAEKMDALDDEEMSEGAEMDQDELDLEEILAELEGLEEAENEELTETEEELTEAEEESEEETETETETEEEFDIENMSENDLKSFIESVVDEMISSGELEANDDSEAVSDDLDDMMNGEESEESEESEEMINIDELLAEMQDDSEELGESEDLNEVSENTVAIMAALSALGLIPIAYATAKGHEMAKAGKFGDKVKKAVEKFEKVASGSSSAGKMSEEKSEELKEAYDAIEQLKKELNTINLLNAKLLYTNKIFKGKNLSENQKVKVLSTFDKASSVKEVKLVYESLINSLSEKKKTPIKESLGFASKATGTKESTEKPIIAEDKMISRFQKLAGIIK